MSSSGIFALRKQGQSRQALEMARSEYGEGSSDVWLLRAYAWTLYDHVKQAVDAYEAKNLSPTGMSSRLSIYMREFSDIGNPLRGDSTFSQMIRLVVKASKDWQEFLLFARWAGSEDFSDEDKTPFTTDDGKTLDSLQQRFVRAICREVAAKANDLQSDRELIGWGQGVLDQALRDAPNDQWFNYYQSKLHLARGEVDHAIKRLAPALRRQSRAAWPWSLLGGILEVSRPSDAITCYAYATQVAREEQEVGKTRIHLARMLFHASRFNEAAQQAKLALNFREQHSYKVPEELKQLLAADWYREVMSTNRMKGLPNAEVAAKELMLELDRHNLKYVKGVIDHINTDKALSYVATDINSGLALSHRRFPNVVPLPPGTIVEVGCPAQEAPPVDWRLSESTALPGLCENLYGQLERHEGKDFAFIRAGKEDVFVPPGLAQAFSPGQKYEVSCLAIKRTNKQGKTGWRAVKFFEERRGCL